MGVKDLWPILQASCTNVNIADLQGQSVAVDLSGWIYESFGAGQVAEKISKPHIRILFSRVKQLLKHGLKPVFVLEGKPPSLKEGELQKRKQSVSCLHYSQYVTPEGDSESATKRRPSQVTEECCELLHSMGIPYIQAIGEAEATCAMLNQSGLVDACMTNDNDVFLFGAKTVYRHFSGNEKDHYLECYSIDSIKSKCDLDRESLIAFALLVGCDYTKGAYGVGEDKASKLLNILKSQYKKSPLDRFKAWRCDQNLNEIEEYKELKKPTHCGQCDHPGSKTTHEKQGCTACGSATKCTSTSDPCNCEWHQKKSLYENHKLEICIRNSALKDPNFPSQEVIQEFLSPTWKPPENTLWWNRPDVQQVQEFLQSSVYWSKDDILKKMLPVLTAWDLTDKQECLSQARRILRGKTHNRIEVYEIEWDHVEGLQAHDLVTFERKELFAEKFPEMAQQFEDLYKKTKDTPKKWKTQGHLIEQREAAIKKNRKITDMFLRKKKRADIVRDSVVSARKKLDFHNIESFTATPSATRTSPRKTKRPMRYADSPASQPSIKKLFMSQSVNSMTKNVPDLQTKVSRKSITTALCPGVSGNSMIEISDEETIHSEPLG